jgi:hypothetical protein
MKENENNLEKAVEALKNGQIPSGPSKELADSTLTKLNQISEQSDEKDLAKQVVLSKRFKLINISFKVAAAVILLIAVGYTAGRISAPKPLDMEQIQTALEPAIREKVLEEVTQYVQLGLAGGYVQIREELTEQYQQDLRQAALEILTTSGTITNRLLQDLIYSIETAQFQNRQWTVAALEQIELNRLEDKDRLGNALVNFAVQTEEEFDRTQQNMALIAKILTDTQSDDLIQDEIENSSN